MSRATGTELLIKPAALLCTGLALLVSPAVQAAPGGIAWSVQALLGFDGELEVDELEYQGRSTNGFDDDLESDLGLAVTGDIAVLPRLRVGGRGAITSAEGDDTDLDLFTVDAGAYARYLFETRPVGFYLAGGVGLTWFEIDPDPGDEMHDLGGHLVLGGGLEYPLRPVTLTAGLLFSYQKCSPEEDGLTFEDTEVRRLVLTAGLAF